MTMKMTTCLLGVVLVGVPLATSGCGGVEEGVAYASIKNDFNNPEMSFQPPWTICRSSYLGVDFGTIPLDATSPEQVVSPGLDNVLMVAAWNDPTCAATSALPIASKNEEEIVPGQRRTIAINLPNHQGACPPEGVAPIPQTLYDRILALWPEFGFLPYDQRTQNPECL
jgi:hypothetical protein